MAPRARPTASKVNPRTAATIANETKQSRQQAASAAAKTTRGQDEVYDQGSWLLTPDGRPMIRIDMAASELIPVGQFANVSVGPGRITMFIDPRNPEPITAEERKNIAAALNLLTEIVEMDVIAENRDMIIESVSSGK